MLTFFPPVPFPPPWSLKLSLGAALALEEDAASTLLHSAVLGLPVDTFGSYKDVTASEVSKAAEALLKSQPSYAVYGRTAGVPTLKAVTALIG